MNSTGYPVDSADPSSSLVQALDRFHANYRVAPIGVTVTDEELNILQRGLPSSDFALIEGMLHLRKLPITLVKSL
jgi:hypothetical protein